MNTIFGTFRLGEDALAPLDRKEEGLDDEDVVEAGPEEQMDTEDNEQEKAKAEQEAKFQVKLTKEKGVDLGV